MSNNKEILYVGRLQSEKGVRQLLEAVAPLPGEWRLSVAGDGPERKACQDLAEKLEIAHRVDFMGWLSESEIKSLYRRCAVVVVPSLWPEPYGRVGPEACVQGRPVVGFGVGGVMDWLEDGVTGYVVSPGDVTQLGLRIETLLESPSLRAQMGRNARAIALEMWRVDQHVDFLMRVFRQASNGTGVV
jgi:glycosyltransferase involved in cell wall biosynthesis